jgi:hypothetical protein
MDLIQEYQNNLASIKTLSQEQETLKKKKGKESNQMSFDYRDKIHALEMERDNKIRAIEVFYENQEMDKGLKITKLREVHDKVEMIITLLLIKPETVSFEDSHVINRHGSVEPLGSLFSDEYLDLRTFIIENRKPVNKYTLCVYGNILFPKEIIKPLYSYGLPGDTQYHKDIAIGVRDFTTSKAAKDYFDKNKEVLLTTSIREFVLQYQSIKAEYLEVISTYKLKDFKPLYVLECKCCGFVLTEIGAERHSLQDGKCPSCDISLKEANLIARTSNENLPLLLDRVWKTEAAEEFYHDRMSKLKPIKRVA